MKYALFLPMLTMLFIACDKDNEEDNIEPPVNTEKYKFIELNYNISNSEDTVFEKLLRTIEYKNPTNIEQTLPIGDMSTVKSFMFFEANDKVSEYFFTDSILVNIPELIDDGRIYLTKEKYLFSPNNINLPIKNLPNDTLHIEANSIINVNIYIVLKEYTVGFDLLYWDKVFNQQKKACGKWKKVEFIKLRYEYM